MTKEAASKAFENLKNNLKETKFLLEKRNSAFQDYVKLGLPSIKNEEWRYTPLAKKAMDAGFEALSENIEAITPEIQALIQDFPFRLVFLNGKLLFQNLPENCIAKPFAQLNEEEVKLYLTHYDHAKSYQNDGFHALNTALNTEPLLLICKNIGEKQNIAIFHILDTQISAQETYNRFYFVLEKKSKPSFTSFFIGKGAQIGMYNQVSEFELGEDAILDYTQIQNLEANHFGVCTIHVIQKEKSISHTSTISLKGGMLRNNLNFVIQKPDSEANMMGLYFLNEQSHIDNHTLADHQAENCQSNETYKGVLNDASTAVFNGKIIVRQDSQKTNAYQSNKNLLLSSDATVFTKPQLEIFADDVKCSHGCTIGKLNPDDLFYLKSRGIGHQTAMNMLTKAFAHDVIGKITDERSKIYVESCLE